VGDFRVALREDKVRSSRLSESTDFRKSGFN
jgi:hypothetical protein